MECLPFCHLLGMWHLCAWALQAANLPHMLHPMPRCTGADMLTRWVLQQDNDPCHDAASSIIQAWNQKHPGVHVTLLQGWPGNSPDLNCIENLWAWAEAKVNAMGCKDVEDFKKNVIETLQNVPQQLLQGPLGSMGKRIKACIALEGDKTKY